MENVTAALTQAIIMIKSHLNVWYVLIVWATLCSKGKVYNSVKWYVNVQRSSILEHIKVVYTSQVC